MSFASLIPFLVIEGLMAIFTAWLIKKGSEIKVPKDAWKVLFLLSMMAQMFLSVVLYLYFPSALGEIILLGSFVMMVIIFALGVMYLLDEPKSLEEIIGGVVRLRSLIIGLIIVLVILSDVFTAWSLALIGGPASTAGGLQEILTTITNSSSSFWFIFMMSSEMAITLFFIKAKLPKAFIWLIAAQITIMILSPTAIANPVWASVSLAVSSAIMTFLFIFVFNYLQENQTLSKGILNYLIFLILAYALMMGGQFVWLVSGNAAVFVLSIIVEMLVYLGIVLDEKKLVSSNSVSWQSLAYWAFGFLFLIFVIEFFMSGVVDIEVFGQTFFNGLASASTAWPLTRILSAGLYVGTMAVFTAWLIKKGSEIKTLMDARIVLFLLFMMATIFISTVVYVQGSITLLQLIGVNMAVGGISGYATISTMRDQNESIIKNKTGNIRPLLIGLIVTLVILSEIFMGWTFAFLGGTISISGSLQGLYSALIHSSSSFWFIFMMSAEMAITLFFIRDKLPKKIGLVLAFQTVIMILSPTAIANSVWASASLVAGSAVMILLFIYILEFMYKNRTTNSGILNYLLLLMLAYALMMGGQFVWLLNGDPAVFVLSIVIEMGVYFGVLLSERSLVSSEPKSWQSMPYYAFGILIFLFIAEFFMGAVLNIQAYGISYFSSIIFASIYGSFWHTLTAGFYNFIIFFGTVTLSPWYLIMMGIEMGALVAFRIKYTRELETKIMFVLMILAYALYTVLIPVFIIPNEALRQTPWLGWTMGIGSSGAIGPNVLLALLGTFLVSGILSFLFGSRQLCSVVCMAPLMYQGITIDAMRSFNESSQPARRLLTNRISVFYKVVESVVWISLLVAGVISYLTSVGILDLSIFGTDPAFFLYIFYFGFLWYILWMLIPFVGTYACVSTGMCSWGAFNQCVSRVGLFRLKVADRVTCSRCLTKDCANVCPTGLTDLPPEFISKGSYRNYKCVGCGNCVSACPYQIMSFYDVRHWLKEKLQLGQ